MVVRELGVLQAQVKEKKKAGSDRVTAKITG